jgi:hypothetical protein
MLAAWHLAHRKRAVGRPGRSPSKRISTLYIVNLNQAIAAYGFAGGLAMRRL